MKKILICIKPFLVFQFCFVIISFILLCIGPDSPITTIISFCFFFPVISGGVYILGFIFGLWTEFRNQNGFSILLLITLISYMINCIAWLPEYFHEMNFLFSLAFKETIGFLVGQLVVFILEYMIKKSSCK